MRLLLGFVLGLTGAALFLSSLDHQAVTRELRAWFDDGRGSEASVAAGPSPAGDPAPLSTADAPSMQTSASTEVETPAAAEAPSEDTGMAPEPAPAPALPAEPAVTGSPDWQPIWRPFNAPSAAEGFAAHLTALTGDTYRVRRVADRAFQVELAYHGEAERRAHLERVRALTGLELDGGPP